MCPGHSASLEPGERVSGVLSFYHMGSISIDGQNPQMVRIDSQRLYLLSHCPALHLETELYIAQANFKHTIVKACSERPVFLPPPPKC